MKKWLKLWPFLVALVVAWFNLELVVLPWLLAVGISGWKLFCICLAIGEPQLLFWTWFVGWVGRFIKENPTFKDFYNDVRAKGVDKILRKLIKLLVESLFKDTNTQEPKNSNRIIRGDNFFTMFLLGVGIGTWILGIFIFYATKSYVGLLGLFVGDLVKIACFVLLANILGVWFYVLLSFFAIFKAYKFLSPIIKNKLKSMIANP